MAVQRFADEHNDQRLKNARVQSKVADMQLDHAVSQDTIKKLVKVLIKLQYFVSPKDTSYVKA